MDTEYTSITISLPKHLLEEFEKYCDREGMKLSSRIAVLIKKDLKEE